MRSPPLIQACQHALSLFRSCADSHIVGISWVHFAYRVWKMLSGSRHPGPLALTISFLLLYVVLCALDVQLVLQLYLLGLGTPQLAVHCL